MKKIKLLFISVLFLVPEVTCSQIDGNSNPTSDKNRELHEISIADPTIFLNEGTYYLYGTSQGNLGNYGRGFLVFTSQDLKNWEGPKGEREGFALREEDSFGSKGFWAPQVFKYNGEFYMAYTANENIAIAKSDSPLGPFKNSGKALEAPVKQIDPFVFIDDDGKKYLYHVRLTEGNKIFVAEMNDDFMSIKPETLTHCITAEEEWEDTQNVAWPVAEGPTILKEEETYYLLYSANDFRNPDYAVGYATSTNPTGPWKKSEKNPIIHRGLVKQNGSGHGDVFFDKKGDMQYILHTHSSKAAVHPRKAAMVELDFTEVEGGKKLVAKEETFKFLKGAGNE